MNNGSIKSKKIIAVSAVFLSAISLIVLGIGFYLFANPKTVMLQSIGKFKNNVKNIVLEANDFADLDKKDQVNFNMKSTINLDKQELFSINMDYSENKKEKNNNFILDYIQNNNSILRINGLTNKDSLYFNIENMMNSYYTNYKYMSLFNEVDFDEITDLMYKSIKKELKKKDITKTKETIKLDGKDKSVNKLSYTLDREAIITIFKDFEQRLLKDKDLVNDLNISFGYTKEELETIINKYIKNLEDSKIDDYIYNVYYYGFNNIVLIELINNNYIFEMMDYKDTITYSYSINNTNIFKISITEADKENKINGSFSQMTFKGSYSKDKGNINLFFAGLPINITYNNKIDEKKNKIDSDIKIMIVTSVLDIKSTITFNDTIINNSIDTNSSKNIDELSEEETNILMSIFNTSDLFSKKQFTY